MSIDEEISDFLSAFDAVNAWLAPKRRREDSRAQVCTTREVDALRALSLHLRVTMSELAALIDVPLSTATRIVARLVSKRLLARHRSVSDQRCIEVTFGPLGEEVDRYIRQFRHAKAREILNALSSRERKAFLRQLTRITHEVVSTSDVRNANA
jgi:DNA-binding MarR family transcriptional regulator